MCVLALLLSPSSRRSLIVAANRDEFTDRPSGPPQALEPGIVGGKDLRAGGTWLGVNRHGVFVAVTNRRTPPRTDAGLSRGLLALEALRCRSLACLEKLVRKRTAEGPVAGFNLVAVAEGAGVCLHWDGTLRPVPFGPGAHIVSTDRDLDDSEMPEKRIFDRHRRTLPANPPPGDFAAFLSSHEGDRPVCKHGEGYGTVSSTIYVRGSDGDRLLYADGPPCRAEFADVSEVLPS